MGTAGSRPPLRCSRGSQLEVRTDTLRATRARGAGVAGARRAFRKRQAAALWRRPIIGERSALPEPPPPPLPLGSSRVPSFPFPSLRVPSYASASAERRTRRGEIREKRKEKGKGKGSRRQGKRDLMRMEGRVSRNAGGIASALRLGSRIAHSEAHNSYGTACRV